MSNGPKKITELPVASTYANTDLILLVGNVSSNATTYSVTPAVLFANVNATRINVSNANITTANVSSNTLTLGTSTIASNGYSYLPNGLKMNFGRFVANTTSQVTFTSAFATAVVSISVTPANTVYLAANVPYVFTSNTTTANIYSASTTTTSNCYYLAIGY
jgi:hypothetical protein